MTIKKRTIAPKESYPLENYSYMDGRIGFWGNVEDVDSNKMRASVRSDTGVLYVGIPFTSREWVSVTDNFVTGERYLPQKGARVFVLMPTETITGAFILCSGYAAGDSDTKKIFSDKNNIEKNNNIYERITQSGWKFKEFYKTGNIEFISPDNVLSLEINVSDDSEESKEKGTEIVISGNTIELTDNGLILTDKNNNIIEMKSSGITITDVNNNVIDMSSTSVKINGNFEVLQ